MNKKYIVIVVFSLLGLFVLGAFLNWLISPWLIGDGNIEKQLILFFIDIAEPKKANEIIFVGYTAEDKIKDYDKTFMSGLKKKGNTIKPFSSIKFEMGSPKDKETGGKGRAIVIKDYNWISRNKLRVRWYLQSGFCLIGSEMILKHNIWGWSIKEKKFFND